MICPSCGYKNIPGTDECESCHEDLSSIDGLVPKSRIEKALMGDPISTLKPRPPVVVSEDSSVSEAARKMVEGKMGCVLVMGGGELVGIFTERDILFKLLGKGADLSKARVGEIMSREPETLAEDDTLAYAVNRMSVSGFRHIPIVRNGKPVGVISVRDVLRHLSKVFP